MVAASRRIRVVRSRPEKADAIGAARRDLADVGSEDHHEVRHVGMANRSEGLLRRDRARDDALAAFGILEFVQLAPNLVEDRLGLFPGLDVSVRLAPLQVEADSAAAIVRQVDRPSVRRFERAWERARLLLERMSHPARKNLAEE